LHLLYILLVLLLVARIGGEIAERHGQPALVGELLAGIGLGMIAQEFSGMLPVLSQVPENEVFTALTDLAIFFLMLLAGIEMHPRELVQASRGALAVALGGMALPLALGFGIGWWYLPDSEYRLAQSLFLATALAVTAVPVSVKVLMDLGKLKTRLGETIVSAAVFDDILSLVLLAVLTAVIKTGGLPEWQSLLWLLGKVISFFVIASLLGRYAFPWIGRMLKRAHAQHFEFSGLLIAALAYSLLAEALGMHFLLGAFLAGLFLVRRTIDRKVYEEIRKSVTACTVGFFAPVFFASIGMHLDLRAAAEIPGLVVLLVGAAFFGKLVGSGLPAYGLGFSRRDALAIGTGMSARGAVELIIADIALRAGLFDYPQPVPPAVANLFSAVVIMAVATTLATPVLLKRLVGRAAG